MMAREEMTAFPMADPALTQEILNLVHQAALHNQLKKGANECNKTLHRGTSEMIIIAADTKPLCIVSYFSLFCEEKNVPCIYVPSKVALGRASNIQSPAIAVSIISNEAGELQDQIRAMKEKIERLMV